MLPGWDALLSPDALAVLERVGRDLEGGADRDRVHRELRASGLEPDLCAAILTQASLRERAVPKFGELARELLFTPAALEQATRLVVARGHARRFVEAGFEAGHSRIADLGCGIGTESIALLEAGLEPYAVERDPFTSRLAAYNLGVVAARSGRRAPRVLAADATEVPLSGVDGAFLDPARRTAGHRNTRRAASPDDYSPSLDFAFGLASSSSLPVGVKLGPGLDRDLIPDDAEAQWVSVDGQAVETAVWFGDLARPGVRRAALVLRAGETHELTAPEDAEDVDVRDLGEFLYEPDGAVIRARLIGRLARDLDAGMASPGIAYLTADALRPTPFAQAFRIIETLPAREKDLRKAIAARGIGRLEIKKRGTDVDPAALRKRLKLRGPESGTLVLTRDPSGRHIAILAERC